jgi:hypothetical protein
VRYARATCARSAGGCAVMCAMWGEKRVEASCRARVGVEEVEGFVCKMRREGEGRERRSERRVERKV